MHVFASAHQAGPAGKQETCGAGKRVGIWAGVVDKEAMVMLEGSANVYVNRVSGGRVCFH